jgi:hypothetical protein
VKFRYLTPFVWVFTMTLLLTNHGLTFWSQVFTVSAVICYSVLHAFEDDKDAK